ncbi:hypothetical protein J6590_107051, partial [Homalodisca vitripennis]
KTPNTDNKFSSKLEVVTLLALEDCAEKRSPRCDVATVPVAKATASDAPIGQVANQTVLPLTPTSEYPSTPIRKLYLFDYKSSIFKGIIEEILALTGRGRQ